MATTTTVTAEEIRAHVGDQSFSRGQQYFRDGAICDARRQGATLKARCEGSSANAYRVEATVEGGRITQAHCSCPVGDSGHCKHVAALLLTWQANPGQFTELPAVDAALEQRSKAELIALIKQMLRQEPDLEWLLEAPLPAAGQPAAPVNPETYRRQAAAIFRGAGDEWGVEDDIADGLLAINAIGDGFVEQQNFAGAAAVYSAVLSQVLENYETYQDQDGELGHVVSVCAKGLGQCLVGQERDPETREVILEELFDVYRFDRDHGSLGWSEGVPELLVDHTTPEERRVIAEWVREALPQGTDWSANYKREAYGGLLLDLEAETLNDETFLGICRETGRNQDLIDRLLTLGRLEEATQEAERVEDYPLLGLVELFIQHGHAEVAERLMVERSGRTQDSRILEWLKNRYIARDDKQAALELAERIFRARPGLSEYQEIRSLAVPLGRWEALRPELREVLQQQRHSGLLIQVYLDEGEIDQALAAVKEQPRGWSGGWGGGYHGDEMRLKVARAAEETRPRAALEIYRQAAERRIEERGRGNYQEACTLLKKARALYHRLEENQTWSAYIAALRERNRSLRALKEEMAAAGL
jgi:uncharacterized Zn finger protein